MEGKVTEKRVCCHATTLDLPFPHVERSERLWCSQTRIFTLNVRQIKRCVVFFPKGYFHDDDFKRQQL